MQRCSRWPVRNAGYDQQAFQRAEKGVVAGREQGRSFNLASAEDIILHKLYWYRIWGGNSERQWNDVRGVLKVQGNVLDLEYMHRW